MATADDQSTTPTWWPNRRAPSGFVRCWLVICACCAGMDQPTLADVPVAETSLQDKLIDDARDGRLDEFSFLEASLIASGIDQSPALLDCQQRFTKHCQRFRATSGEYASARELAVAILSFLHREVLTENYDLKSTRVDQALRTGHYNCVASTILFRCLSSELGGVTPEVMATPSHVFCRYPGADHLDVETTCPNWFALPPTSPLIANHPSQQSVAKMRTLSDVEVLGKLFYNRATDRLEARQFAAACALLRMSILLDPADGSAHENLLAAINNWSLQRCESKEFAHAAQLLAEGAAISPEYLPIQMNDLHVHQQWALHLCERGQFSQALEMLTRCHQRRPTAVLFDQGRFAVIGLWADSLFFQGQDAAAWQLFDQVIEQHAARPDIVSREVTAIVRAVERRLALGQQQSARKLLEQGLARQPASLQLKNMLRDLTDPKS